MNEELANTVLHTVFGDHYFISTCKANITSNAIGHKIIHIDWTSNLHKSYFHSSHKLIMTILLCVGRTALLNDILLLEILPQLFVAQCTLYSFTFALKNSNIMQRSPSYYDISDITVAGEPTKFSDILKDIGYYGLCESKQIKKNILISMTTIMMP